MKETMMYLSSIKSRYFMLLVYLFLIAGATSCRDDNFESDLTDDSIQLSKAELIQQALRRLPQTRINPSGIAMVTIKDTVTIKGRCSPTEEMMIVWNADSIISIPMGTDFEYTYVYTDNHSSHGIYLLGSELSIQSLNVDNNGLILLDIYSNENLTALSCVNNHLEAIDLTSCTQLMWLYTSNNEFSIIDVSNNPNLFLLETGNNPIKYLDLGKNTNLMLLDISYTQVSDIDLSKNIGLTFLDVSYTSITSIDLHKNLNLESIVLEGLLIEMFNNHSISDTSFSIYSQLWQLNVAYTPFTALDLSNNPKINRIDISGTEISQLDLSYFQIQYLYASDSKLANLICEKKDLTNLYYLRIERTPFEEVRNNILALALALPLRTEDYPGHLYSYSPFLHDLEAIGGMNWLINQ